MTTSCDSEEHEKRARRAQPIEEAAFERAAAAFRALGDVARLKLLERLSEGEWCVTELAEAGGATASTISKQLRVLRAEHLVTRRRDGSHVRYALVDKHVFDLVRSALDHAGEERVASDLHDE